MVSFSEKKATLTADENVTDKELTAAVGRAGPYRAKIVEVR